MQRVVALFERPDSGPMVRYAVAGGTVAAVYLGTPLALTSFLSQ